jgi:hypothetical protein
MMMVPRGKSRWIHLLELGVVVRQVQAFLPLHLHLALPERPPSRRVHLGLRYPPPTIFDDTADCFVAVKTEDFGSGDVDVLLWAEEIWVEGGEFGLLYRHFR